jgi:hypothetical protein
LSCFVKREVTGKKEVKSNAFLRGLAMSVENMA